MSPGLVVPTPHANGDPMRLDPSLLWTWDRKLDRLPYLLAGVGFFVVKFALDWVVATQFFSTTWSPLNYLIWPSDQSLKVFELTAPDREFALAMLLVSLPFIYVGVLLSLHRLRAADLPLPLILLFFIPVVNLVFILALVLFPTRETMPTDVYEEAVAIDLTRRVVKLRLAHRRLTVDSYWRSGLIAVLASVAMIVGAVFLSANLLQSYGFGLFVGSPFALGLISVLLFGFSRPQPVGPCLLVATVTASVAGFAILVFAIEGLLCLIMLAPLAFGLVYAGAGVGYLIQSRPWLQDQTFGLMLAVMLVLPGLMAAESVGEPVPDVRAVRTSLVIDAPRDRVWQYVVAFPPLGEPEELMFRCGVAYPLRAEMDGHGVGAVRRCVFTTGTFVEPIEVWDAPTLLRFRVEEYPEPMEEFSFYHIHPAHLDHYLVSKRGQFLLEELPDGRTRLEGTTWYTNRMWPAWYWHLWADYIIHRIHGRVLRHVKTLAEGE